MEKLSPEDQRDLDTSKRRVAMFRAAGPFLDVEVERRYAELETLVAPENAEFRKSQGTGAITAAVLAAEDAIRAKRTAQSVVQTVGPLINALETALALQEAVGDDVTVARGQDITLAADGTLVLPKDDPKKTFKN